ncbi:Bestrophin, RFP-TM, chloride channel-domain-containing protein [Epithele typhae]|uniref:Bestrophin, RFP-TM, chloride channel-domain-containing protein n=1 Tax=Epithele typhae TaxID=378194 RepID=UPI002007DB5E|nr:Bestrophin, RFP-TM, chloride channel-domain-containing protein [Epithele typhae]KAH9940400.1 Bestrophin, RFP-TM, chloride channel-domain-containing protein [Epithele typhae]
MPVSFNNGVAASSTSVRLPRSGTGHHTLLPAFDASQTELMVPVVTRQSLLSWTFGRGTVIWRIWPAVLLHTVFAAVIVTISMRTRFNLGIPNVMLTVLGVVIGFVISYRASSGYDRYYQGRTAWSDIARVSRVFSRLAWLHVPLRVQPTTYDANGNAGEVDIAVVRRVMAEKRAALDLIEAYSIAVKHHLRGETGIYYQDLYHLHPHHRHPDAAPPQPAIEIEAESIMSSPRDLHPEIPPFALSTHALLPTTSSALAASPTERPPSHDPTIPAINSYGTFAGPPLHHTASHTSLNSVSTNSSDRRPLLPGAIRASSADEGMLSSVSADLVPFGSVFRSVGRLLGLKRKNVRDAQGRDIEDAAGLDAEVEVEVEVSPERAGADIMDHAHHHHPGVHRDAVGRIQRVWRTDDVASPASAHPHTGALRAHISSASARLGFTHAKHRPRVAGGGASVPLEIVRALSIWLSILDERGCVPGNALGGMFGCLASMEDSLSTLERILTTPLPFVYSVHIRHTVWIYLFFLPFQLVDLFKWYAIPGVGFAAFTYLGFLAAGEEIEQPFGYDENDLDLDFFCRAIIHADIARLKQTAGPHAFFGAHHASGTVPSSRSAALDIHSQIDTVFGGGRHAQNPTALAP